MIFDSEFIISFDGSLEDLWLLGELDNPITVATLSSLRETKEKNEKLNLRSFEKADKDDVEKYLYSDQDKFFVKLVLIKKYGFFCQWLSSEGWPCIVLPGNKVDASQILH